MSLPRAWKEGCASLYVYIASSRDPTVRKRRLYVKAWTCVKDIKDQLQTIYNTPSSRQRLFFEGKELKNTRTLQECGIYKDGFTILFKIEPRHNGVEPSIQAFGASYFPKVLIKTLHKAQRGLTLGLAPVLAMEGTGGTYFLRGPSQRYLACFKPQDEEPFSENNPRGFTGNAAKTLESGLRKGILAGEACEREVAAYILDRNHFSCVPATALVEAMHPSFKYSSGNKVPKLGSFQEYVVHDEVVGDLSPTVFSAREVHKIAILDIRLINSDRNDANILVRKKRIRKGDLSQVTFELVPIDHGYCLPDCIEIAWCDWCWFDWPQLKENIDDETKAYVDSIDIDKDVQDLKSMLSLRVPCLLNLRIAGSLLKKGVRAGLSLYDIACIICRQNLEMPSPLELIILEAIKISKSKIDSPMSPCLSSHSQIVSENEDEDNTRVNIRLPTSSQCLSPCSSPKNSISKVIKPSTSPIASYGAFALHSTLQSKEDVKKDPIYMKQRPVPIVVSNTIPVSSPISSPPGFWASNPPYRSEWDQSASIALNHAAQHIEKFLSPSIKSPQLEESNNGNNLSTPLTKYLGDMSIEKAHVSFLHGLDAESSKQVFHIIEKLLEKEVTIRKNSFLTH